MTSLGNVFIIGDSYSTYEGYVPEGYRCYYRDNKEKISCVEKTWWHMLLNITNSTLVMNNSSSGTTICKTGYNNAYCDAESFVTRIQKYLANGISCGKNIDTVIIFGGTNDAGANSPLGTYKESEFSEDDFKKFLPSYSFLLKYLTQDNTQMRIISVINCDIKKEFIDWMVEISEKYNIEYVLLKDIDKVDGHPTEKGMEQIKNQILNIL